VSGSIDERQKTIVASASEESDGADAVPITRPLISSAQFSLPILLRLRLLDEEAK
jgi:hypothetical protein